MCNLVWGVPHHPNKRPYPVQNWLIHRVASHKPSFYRDGSRWLKPMPQHSDGQHFSIYSHSPCTTQFCSGGHFHKTQVLKKPEWRHFELGTTHFNTIKTKVGTLQCFLGSFLIMERYVTEYIMQVHPNSTALPDLPCLYDNSPVLEILHYYSTMCIVHRT